MIKWLRRYFDNSACGWWHAWIAIPHPTSFDQCRLCKRCGRKEQREKHLRYSAYGQPYYALEWVEMPADPRAREMPK